MHEALEAVQDYEVPDPPSELRFHGVNVFEVTGPLGEELLVAFGLVALSRWLEVVNAYYEAYGLEHPWDPEDPEKVVDGLGRLHYSRVRYEALQGPLEAGETPFRIPWGTEGVTPIVVWLVDPPGGEETGE